MKQEHSQDYLDGLENGRQIAGDKSASDLYALRLSMNCPTAERRACISRILGADYRVIASVDDFYWGVRSGIKQAEEFSRRAEVARRIHAEEQADAERRRIKPPCVDCGKRTICKGRCRSCATKARQAEYEARQSEYEARPDVIAALEEQARREALGPTILQKDLYARGWTRKQIQSFPPDFIKQVNHSWRYSHKEKHYVLARIEAAEAGRPIGIATPLSEVFA